MNLIPAPLRGYRRAHDARFVLVRPDTQLLATLRTYGTLASIGEDNVYLSLPEVFSAYQVDRAGRTSQIPAQPAPTRPASPGPGDG